MGLLKLLLAGVVGQLLVEAVGVPLAILVSAPAAFGASLVLGIVVCVLGARWLGPGMIFAGVLAIAAPPLEGLLLGHGLRVLLGEHVAGGSVAEAPGRASATVFRFRDGAPRPELGGSHVRSSGNVRSAGSRRFVVTPVVPTAWARTDPVPVWATAGAQPATGSGGVVVLAEDLEDYRKAIADAERRHGLRSAPAAPVVEWGDPDAIVAGHRRTTIALVLTVKGIWLVGMTIAWFYARRRR